HLGPLALLGFELDASPVGFDELTGEREAEAERGLTADAFFDDAIEAIEYARQVFGRDPGTIVTDPDHRFVVVAVGLDQDPALAVGVGDRVAENVFERLPDAAGVTEYEARGRGYLRVQLLRLLLRPRTRRLDRGPAEARKIDSLALKR